MALVPTGRTRSASVSLQASQSFVPEAMIPAAVGGGFQPGFNQTWAHALGCSLQVTHQGHPVNYSIDPDYEGPGYRIRWVVFVTYQIHHNGAPVPSPIEIESFDPGPWTIVEALPSAPIGQAGYLAGGMGASLVASWTWVEYRNTATGAITEVATDGSIAIAADGSYVFHVTAEDFEATLSPVFGFSETWDTAVGLGSSYGVGVDFNCVTDTSNESTVTCEGLQFTTPDVTMTAGSAVMVGNGLSGELTKDTLGSLAVGSIRGTPDWALEFQVANYDYETGAALAVDTRHYTGSTLISTSSTGYHRYPETGYISDLTGSLACEGQVISYDRNRALFACEGATGANLVRVDPDWADTYGTFADSFQFAGRFSGTNPGLNSQYGLFVGPDFDALTLRLEAEHRFGLLDNVTKLRVNSGAVTADAGGIKVVQSGLAGSWTADRASGWIFRPFGYRFFRFQARAGKAGARFTLRIERKLDNLSGGRYALAYYDFTVNAADTWQECVLDLTFPSRYFDPVHVGAGRYPLHAAAFQPYPEDTSVTFETPSGQNTSFWLRDFEGFHPSGGNRIPALLIGPSCGGDPTADPIHQPPLGYDSCVGHTSNLFGQPRGTHWGRLVANGAMAWNLSGGANSIRAELDALIAHYHQGPGVDTGLHLTKGTSEWLDTTEWESGWAIRLPLWSALPLDTDVTLRGVRRAYTTGYYGSGDLRGGYGPVLTFHGDKVWNGELLGLCHDTFRSLPDVTLQLVDDPAGTVLETASSNGDGLIRLFHRYGVPLPYSNAPLGSPCTSRKQYSGTLPNPTYTTLGERLNGYWVVSPLLRQRDGQDRSNAFRSPDRWPILDRFAYWRDWPTDPAPAAGVDLLQLQSFRLLRSGAQEGTVRVERSGDAGVTWPLTVQVATGGGSTTVPILVRNALDQVWCWYHDQSGNGQVYLSRNSGESWTPYATHAGLRYPRVVRQWSRLLVAGHDRTSLRFYRSGDDGLTLTEIPALALTCPEQLAALAVDRHGYAHLVYRTTGGALHLRRLELDDTWSAPEIVTGNGTQPALALGLEYGLVLYWEGDSLRAARTDAAYAEIVGAVTAPTGFGRCYLGLLTDHQELHHYAAGLDPERERIIRYSGDAADTWAAPA